jgi:cyclic beta-1,2-glucan synthetase
MFEYLMPNLFLRSYPDTLMSVSVQGAILHQMAYAKTRHIPWGISESGFYHFDANLNYQYRAFGVPGLGFKRSLDDDLVVAPYASLMSIQYAPQAVAKNLVALREYGSFGQYGLYESVDFTAARLKAGETSIVIHEYMTHHQGMILMALANYFHNDIMVQRMHNDARIQTIELLLQERVPHSAPLQNPDSNEIKAVQQLKAGPAEIIPWTVPVQTPIPQVNLLTNGEYRVLLSNMGAGYSAWRDIDLTHWQPDGVLDPWGNWIYIQDLEHASGGVDSGCLWSAAFQPIPGCAENFEVNYFAHMAVFRRVDHGITSTLEITVHPDDPLEVRRIHLQNTGSHIRHLQLTSYGEVMLSKRAGFNRNSAFNKHYVESEFVPELDLQIFKRPANSNNETAVYMGHMLVVKTDGGPSGHEPITYHESDRSRFIGRGSTLRKPNALISEQTFLEAGGETIDPIFALGQEFEIKPLESVELAYLTFAGDDRDALIALGRRYRNWDLIERSFHQSDLAARSWLGQENFETRSLKNSMQILSALLHPFKALRASPAVIAANQLSQSRLFRLGVSGDNPILMVELAASRQIDLVREVLQVHRFLQNRHFPVDVVILNCQQSNSGAELDETLHELLSRLNYEQDLNRAGGIFIFFSHQISTVERVLLQTAARVLLTGERGSLDDQMPIYPLRVHHLPEFIPTQPIDMMPESVKDEPLGAIAPIQFFNGYGGFSRDGREYIVDLPHGKANPIPLINVIDYPNIGFMVSETGSQSTWSVNRKNRLTPWSDDPVCESSSETLYLRDEETGEVWTPTPQPAGTDRPYRVSHGAGYTLFEHNSHGLRQRLTLFASPEDPVKIILLKVENSQNRARRITATQYIEWVLGSTHAESMQYLIPEYDEAEACLLVSNPYNAKFSERVAFLIASKALHGLTADRTEFFGRGGTPAFPAALRRIGLETRISPGDDPCAVLQLHIDLLPGGTEEIYFVLGQAENKSQALALARKYHQSASVNSALKSTHTFWDRLLCGLCYPTSGDSDELEPQSLDTLSEPLLLRPGPVGLLSAQRGAFDFVHDPLDEMAAQSPSAHTNTNNNTPDQVFKVIQPSFGDKDQGIGAAG